MPSLRPLIKEINQIAKARFAEIGFRKRKYAFAKDVNDVTVGLVPIGLTSYHHEQVVTSDCGIIVHNKEIERLASEWSGYDSLKMLIATVFEPLYELMQTPTYVSWRFTPECNVHEVFKNIFENVKQYGISYIERLSTTEAVLEYLLVHYSKILPTTSRCYTIPSFDFDYFGARYYDTRTGTFTTVDKAGQFANAYLYCGANPIMMIDPDGNLGWFIVLMITAAKYAAVSATIDVTIAYASGEEFNLAERWGSSFATSFVTGMVTGGLDRGLSSAASLGGVPGTIGKGANHAYKGGKFAGSAVNYANTGAALLEGDLRSAASIYNQRHLDRLAGGVGGLNTYVSLPMVFTNERPAINLNRYSDGSRTRYALGFRGGVIGASLGAAGKNAFTVGHNIFFNGSNWNDLDDEGRRVLVGHEFEHVFQYEHYGYGITVPYLFDKVDKPADPRSPEGEAWRRSRGNRLEYEAYLRQYENANHVWWLW